MITIKSHGFKFSRPEANIVFDVSFFKNPWRDKEVRVNRKKIIEFVRGQKESENIIKNIVETLRSYEESFPGENVQVAICCSAGEFRSPVIADMVYHDLKALKVDCKLIQSPNSKI